MQYAQIVIKRQSQHINTLTQYAQMDIKGQPQHNNKIFTDPALNFPSSGYGSRQKFRIYADPDPSSNPCYLSLFRNCKQNHLKFNHKEESINYLPFSTSYYSPTKSRIQREITFLFICSFIFCWIRIHNTAKKGL